jgi:hypothetical protein
MYAERSKVSHQLPAIKLLAEESHMPIDSVIRLYESELAKLEVGARVRGFLPIFAIKKVRAMLRQRSVAIGSSKPRERRAHARTPRPGQRIRAPHTGHSVRQHS